MNWYPVVWIMKARLSRIKLTWDICSVSSFEPENRWQGCSRLILAETTTFSKPITKKKWKKHITKTRLSVISRPAGWTGAGRLRDWRDQTGQNSHNNDIKVTLVSLLDTEVKRTTINKGKQRKKEYDFSVICFPWYFLMVTFYCSLTTINCLLCT